MKPIMIEFINNSSEPLYIQLYKNIRDAILSGDIAKGEKLPSLRSLSKSLSVSMTTTQLAYDQLLVEGYIISKPQSGYYAADVFSAGDDRDMQKIMAPLPESVLADPDQPPYICDPDCFDFNKWKKCSSKIFNEHWGLLLYGSDPQGEGALRHEISKYVYTSRGVTCSPEQIIIGAGTQQITGQLCRILPKMDINHVSVESPGYLPVQNSFRDSGFSISHISVGSDGIEIERLPVNISTAVYVSPSNQFPTGAVMPVGRRRQLLRWASDNDSIIIEDDYDSELRYFGRPVPALRSLDNEGRVVYLGSFSSTLFPAIKISYMILPPSMAEIFSRTKGDYAQTCSKAEQLTLALFMEEGYYYTGIRKLRNLYSQKLSLTLEAFAKYGDERVVPVNTHSGINLIINFATEKTADELCDLAKSAGLHMVPFSRITESHAASLIFYYSKLPVKMIDPLVGRFLALLKS